MAGYTSRNFLSLTIPSVLGLSIIWFLRKRSGSKKIKEAIEIEDIQSDQYLSIYPMKLKNQGASSVGESACSEMQLKETESRAETQLQTSNGIVQQIPKVKGKSEDMARLCENGSSCSMDEPVTNGCRKDNVLRRNSDSKIELTNGMTALCLNGVSSSKESFNNGTCKSVEMEKITNGFTNTNGVVKHKDNYSAFENKEDSTTSKSDVEVDKSCCKEDIELAGAKEQHQADVHVQLSSVSNDSRKKEATNNLSSIDATLPAKKLIVSSDDHTAVVSNGFSSMSIDTTLTNTKNTLNSNSDHKVIDTNEHLSAQSVCVVANSDELSKPVDTAEPSTSQCSIVLDDAKSSPSVNCILNDNDNPMLPSTVLTDAEQLTPPVDYVVADSTELLTVPIDDTGVETQGEMLESPGATYCDSLEYLQSPFLDYWYCDTNLIDSFFTSPEMEYHQSSWSTWWHSNTVDSFIQEMGSTDSGRGASEIQFTISEDQVVYMVYEFEILPENCGRLIGRLGRHVKYINKQTNANIVIKKHPCCNDKKLCAITGTEAEINAALKLVRKRFPIEHYPSVTLAQINSIPISTLLCPETLKLSLPEGGVFEALLCSTVSAGHFFLQQPTHPTFYQLPPLTNAMNALYGETETPVLDNPTKGNICAAEIGGGWYRAEIDEVYEESDNCRLKFLDYGGYADVAKATIRKIKCDFMLIPFQATECYLAGVMPLDEDGWSAEATALFEQEAQGQLIQGCIVAYAENRVPYVNLYKITGVESVFINQKLVNDGLARGIAVPVME